MSLPKVSVRAIEPEDLEWLYGIENDMDIWGVGATNVPYSRFVLHEYLAKCTFDIYTDKQVRFVIENIEGQSVGIIDLINFNPQHHRAEIGIVIQKPFRGHGYAQAAILHVLYYADSVLHIHQLYALIDKDNAESLKSFLAVGFKQSAVLQDWLFDGKKYQDALLMQMLL
jgi:diamine N-acetyltransferase